MDSSDFKAGDIVIVPFVFNRFFNQGKRKILKSHLDRVVTLDGELCLYDDGQFFFPSDWSYVKVYEHLPQKEEHYRLITDAAGTPLSVELIEPKPIIIAEDTGGD